MQTVDELKYSQSVWGFQPRKAEIRRVCDVKGLLRNRHVAHGGRRRLLKRLVLELKFHQITLLT